MILIDPEDQWLLDTYTWHVAEKGYIRTTWREDGRTCSARLHNAILGCPIWRDEVIDHINRNPADNRRSNLRWVSPTENSVNRNHWGTSGARNVYLMGKKYQVQIRRNGVLHLLGGFDTLDEAVAERDMWLQQQGEKTSG